MSLRSFIAGAITGIVLATATVAAARLNTVGGAIGITSGYGAATAVCVDSSGEIINGSRIEPILTPLADQRGNVATAVTFRCP